MGHIFKSPAPLTSWLWFEVRLKRWERAALLLGASNGLAEKLDAARLVEFPGVLEANTELCESKLGPDRFEAAYSVGFTMSLDRAIAYAVETHGSG